MPQVSIIAIGPSVSELERLQELIRFQTFQNYEFIGKVGSTFPEIWNQAIQRARGEILVLTDTHARPVNNRWLEELVASIIDERTIVKGLEVTSSPLDPSSLAGYKQAFVDHPFDEHYHWAEDTELFCRLKEAGYRFVQLDYAPVIHLSKLGSKIYLKRAFRYGLYWSRLRHRYAEPVELTSVSTAFKRLVAALLNLLGMFIGSIIYRSERRSS